MTFVGPTLALSRLSALLAFIITRTYNNKAAIMVLSTAMFPVSWSRVSSLNTTSKSSEFGFTSTPPPNDVRWLQRQYNEVLLDFGPTFRGK